MPRFIAVFGFVAVLGVAGGCGNRGTTGPGGETPAPAPPAATTAPPATTTAPPATTPAPAPAAGGSNAAQRWTMPNLVGRNLQQAQDAIQALTGNPIFFTASHDATGQGRHQVLDANWKVCSQNIPAGTSITADAKIDFGAVKLTERCP